MTDSPEQYLSVRNFRIVVAQTVIVALGAIGMTMIIVSGGIDLSVGSVIALTGVVTAIALRDGASPFVAVLEGVLAGGLVGVINGLFITRLQVIPFIATLGMLGVARGVAKWIADQQTVNVPQTWVNELAVTFPQPDWLIVAPGVWLTRGAGGGRVARPALHRFRPPRLRPRLERSRRARLRHPGRSTEGLDLRPRRPVRRPLGRDADVAAAPGRSDGRHRHRARRHRGRRHRRRDAQRRRRHDPRLDGRRD